MVKARSKCGVFGIWENFDEEIELDYFSIELRPKTNFAFNEYTAQLKLENLAVSDAFVLAQATAEADLELVDFIVRNLNFNLQGLEAQENVRLNSDSNRGEHRPQALLQLAIDLHATICGRRLFKKHRVFDSIYNYFAFHDKEYVSQ